MELALDEHGNELRIPGHPQHVDYAEERPCLERDDVAELDGSRHGAGAEVIERVGVSEREGDAELEHEEERARFAILRPVALANP